MEPHLYVIGGAFTLQLLLACLHVARHFPAQDFYRVSSLLMIMVTSAWGFAGSWHAVWTGFLALVWMAAAITEPDRRRRRQMLIRHLREMEGPHRP